ncbi:hypothetical protein ACFXKW_20775 [Streptomyces sp. NPDC059193]|uniref:hypothetical protein n=1 Tax=Streptomyces sp. NPDC059193 TaxID=3346763 RepID=UPI0036A627ED
MYGIGLGNLGRSEDARTWLAKSIALGDPMGAVALGTMYLDEGNLDEAERLIKPVADDGNSAARMALAEIRAARRR